MIQNSLELIGYLEDNSLTAVLSSNELSYNLQNSDELKAEITSNEIKAELINELELTGVISIEQSSAYPTYNGNYIVTPKVESQKLGTKNKLMNDDVSIKEIPYFETSNLYGETIYIGSEVNYGN